MSSRIETKLAALGLELPALTSPRANYVPMTVIGAVAHSAGQLPIKDGELLYVGKLGRDLSVADGQLAARQCALNILAHLKAACGGDLDRVKRCIRVGGYVNSMPEFTEQPQVVNGASDLLVEVMGDSGRHARTAVGVAALPRGASVEIEAIFEIEV